MGAYSYFLMLDYFGLPYQVKFLNKNFKSSILGAIFTVSIFILGLAILIKQSSDLLYKLNPTVNKNVKYDSNPLPVESDFSNFTMFSYYYDGNYTELFDPTYFTVDIQNYLRVKGLNPDGSSFLKKSTNSLEWEFCGNNLTKYTSQYNKIDNLTSQLNTLDFKNHICLKNPLPIGGDFNSNFYSNILFKISSCVNSTLNNNSCKSQQEMSKSMVNHKFSIYYLDVIIDSNDFNKPFTSNINNYFYNLDPKSYLLIDLYLQRITLLSDNGWIFESIDNSTIFGFDYFREVITPNPIDNVILKAYVDVSHNRSIYTRNYIKVQQLAAFIGGILKVCTVVAYAIIYFFNQYQYDEIMINLYYDVIGKDPIQRNFSI